MIAIIGRILAPYVLRIVGLLAIIGAVAAILLRAREGGRNAERVERLRRNIEVQHDQLEAAARRPRDRGELTGRMHDGTF